VIDMELVLPANGSAFDASCVNSVKVIVGGQSYPADPMDAQSQCLDIAPAGSSFSDVRDAIRNKVNLSIPRGGLSTVSVLGFAGNPMCGAVDKEEDTPDLIFTAFAQYVGDSPLELPLTPNLSCTRNPVTIRPIELFAMVSGAAPTDSNCQAAGTTDALNGLIGLGTIRPRLVGAGMMFTGDEREFAVMNGVAMATGPTQLGTNTCFALDSGNDQTDSISCVVAGAAVCANAGEIENVVVRDDIDSKAQQFDIAAMTKWHGGMAYVSVWTSSGIKTPIQGATATVDPQDGSIEYVDPPVNGSTDLSRRTVQSTGKSGLFLLYTDTFAKVTITANGKSRTVTLTASDAHSAAYIVVMP